MAKEIELNRGGYFTYWRNGEGGCVDVDVYEGERAEDKEPLIEWSYGKVVGNSILGNASFWLEQAILQAKAEQ